MQDTPTFTHRDLVTRMGRWLRNHEGCGIVLTELRTAVSETPDAIGFCGMGDSILIECKTSRADFYADGQKHFRQFEEGGMGDKRYFAVPKGLVLPSEVPVGWGLLYVSEHRVTCVREPVRKDANKRAELKMLMSVIRRLEISSAVFVTPETKPSSEGINAPAKEQAEARKLMAAVWSPNIWSPDAPTDPGIYEVRCAEAPDACMVEIARRADNSLWVECPDTGTNPLDQYHANLTDAEWRRIG